VSAAIPHVQVAPVKRATDRMSAECLSVERAHALIRGAASAAVRSIQDGSAKPQPVAASYRIEVEFRSSSMANMTSLFPGVERTGPTGIVFEHESMLQAYRHLWALSIFARSISEGVFGPPP